MSLYESGITVGKGWKESEQPGELYVSYKRWSWCPDNEIAKLFFMLAVRKVKETR